MNRILAAWTAGWLLCAAFPSSALERPLGHDPVQVEAAANTSAALTDGSEQLVDSPETVAAVRFGPEAGTNSKPAYVDNHPVQDFEVHFVVALPFALAYSYGLLWSLDALVQGMVPPVMTTGDMWTVAGLAIGGAAAVALGSQGRVMDQSHPRLAVPAVKDRTSRRRDPEIWRVSLLRMQF